MIKNSKIAILGGGNMGMSIARGLLYTGKYTADQIIITRKKSDLPKVNNEGFVFMDDNVAAIKGADIILLSVLPYIAGVILKQIAPSITLNQSLISIVTNTTIEDIKEFVDADICIARAMPNTAIEIRESMTCIAGNKTDSDEFKSIVSIFETLGKTLVIDEDHISSATALGSCGIAFFLRSIRAASQGGTQIGFHAEEAQLIAAQTAKGAAELLLQKGTHPEEEIDKVTTPRGITIAGLNEMEHNGYSSAFIQGIVMSYERANKKK